MQRLGYSRYRKKRTCLQESYSRMPIRHYMVQRVIEFDAVVVGSGIAGLTMAVGLAREGKNVALVTKKQLEDSSTNWAQGGIAGVLDTTNEESIEKHIQDTLDAGDGLCDEDVVRSVVIEAADRIQSLINEGVIFDRASDGNFDLVKEGGHQEKRILHVKDRTGAAIEGTLIKRLHEENVTILEGWMAVDLILEKQNSPQEGIRGIWCLDPEGVVHSIVCKALILATGGAGKLWRETTNPSVATGDGIAMAHRASVKTTHMEFIQFHPTALAMPGEQPFLITEALRGSGAILMTLDGLQEYRKSKKKPDHFSYMKSIDSRGSLATRDIVARATDIVLKKTGDRHVVLVTEHLNADVLKNRFPTINERLSKYGLELGPDPIPVTPAAHYIVGGIEVDKNGQCKTFDGTPYDGIFAVGEVACTGLHGANRLASNSLLEAIVMTHRALTSVLEETSKDKENETEVPLWRAKGLDNLTEHVPLKADREALQSIMSDDVGLVRRDERLQRARRKILHIAEEIDRIWRRSKPTRKLVELRNMSIVSSLVVNASVARKENIGLHYNLDHNHIDKP
ncbi:MAG: L-aspartate oxidase [Euryarchaeota archaeon]|nr:L-aspartate oxidase [Euryarchaeota archaeon]